ncbi:unannotated protein [freshwater metagenome]|uniref:Unannotated protein n=1 Tax=freshwater metagenome TaxID=449393 RepID=A0A6J6QJE3_9ZZZZ
MSEETYVEHNPNWSSKFKEQTNPHTELGDGDKVEVLHKCESSDAVDGEERNILLTNLQRLSILHKHVNSDEEERTDTSNLREPWCGKTNI